MNLTLGHRPRDDERRAGLIDEHRVNLIHNREVMLALHQKLRIGGHVVAQVVKAKLVVGAIGDIGEVGFAALV